jgi:hypothetical protein
MYEDYAACMLATIAVMQVMPVLPPKHLKIALPTPLVKDMLPLMLLLPVLLAMLVCV